MVASVQQAVYERLRDDVDIAAIVGARVYALTAPQDAALPYVVLGRVSSTRQRNFAGYSGVTASRIAVACYAIGAAAANTLISAVRAALELFTGSMGASAALPVQRAFLEQLANDVMLDPTDASETGAHRIGAEFIIWHTEG